MLKHCVNYLIKPLTYVCNYSLITGIFPDRCKFAIVCPIYKKGEKTEINNYRPISLLITLSKILEIIMCERFNQHLESNNILTIEHFGF
jgi:hypothetical protein